MKKLLIATTAISLLALTGCQQLQNSADDLRKQGEQTFNGLSQQADSVKTTVLQTKAKYDEKAGQVMKTVDDVNKLMK